MADKLGAKPMGELIPIAVAAPDPRLTYLAVPAAEKGEPEYRGHGFD